MLVVSVHTENGIDISTVTYDGQSLTLVQNVVHGGGKPRVAVYRLIGPSTGSNDVVITLSGGSSDKTTVGAISYTGIDQAIPIDGVTSATGTSASASVTVSSEAGDYVQDAMASIAAGSPTVGSGQTQHYNVEMGGPGSSSHYGAGSTEDGVTSVTMSWSLSESKEWVIVGLNLNVSGVVLINIPKGQYWDGSSWSSEEEISSSGSPVRWVRTAYSPISARFYERITVTLSDNGYLDAFVWDGDSWIVSNDIGFVGTTPASYRPFDISYETVSGDAVLVYGIESSDTTRDLAYKIWDGSAWSSESYINDPSTSNLQYNWVQLASYPLATGRINEIALSGLESGGDVNGFIWDGSSWGNFQELEPSTPIEEEEIISVQYEQQSGDAMFVWGDGSDPGYLQSRKWMGSWQSELSAVSIGTARPNWITLKADPTSNRLMALMVDESNDLNTIPWDGSSWLARTEHDTAIDTDAQRPADFDWEPSGSKGLLVWGTSSNSVSWRTFDAPSTWSSTTTTSTSGSGTHPWIQLRGNPRDISGDVKIYGATLNSNNELDVFEWDGNSLLVSDFTTLSTSVTSITWESFDLQWRLFGDPTYVSEVEFTGSGGHKSNRLDWAVDSSWTVGDVNVTIQLFSYPGSIYADESSYNGGAHSNYDSDSTPNTDELEDVRIKEEDGPVSDFFDASTNWKLKIRGEKETDTQFDLRVDLVEYELELIKTDWAGVFSITESPAAIADLEITYAAFGQGAESTQEIFIYNFTGLKWDSLGQFSTSALERTVGPLAAGGIASDYIDGSSQVKVSVNGTASDLYTLFSNYLHLRVVPMAGAGVIIIEVLNSGGNDIHLVDLWILDGNNRSLWNSGSSPPFDRTVFPGESYSTSVSFDWAAGENYGIKVVSERGGIWSRVIAP